MRFFPIGIEDTDSVTVNRLEGGDPRKLNRAAVLRPRPSASQPPSGRTAIGNGLAEIGDSIAQSASTNGSAKRRDQDTTQIRNNRDSTKLATSCSAGSSRIALFGRDQQRFNSHLPRRCFML
jgi:hypothetical protein